MCAIVGAIVFAEGGFRITPEYLSRMRDAMSHRGPDGAGMWIDRDGMVGLGHRRLSIIDLSESATQPMSARNDELWLTFNGEIYNHIELRTALTKLGHGAWQTDHSDTEVILRAFEQWGIECVHRFRGMFAFALWDGRRKELWLVRDRIGVKPLYYSRHHGRLVFASEIKALLEDADQKCALNETALFHYLSFLTTPAPDTLFEGIYKLPPGTWLRITARGDVSQSRYWDVLDHATPLVGWSDDDLAEQLLSELRTAVSYRKVSDVPVGVFLSGGIDSSTITALFGEGEPLPVNTFSIGYEGEHAHYRNELDYAQLMASAAGTHHHQELLRVDDLIDFVPKMVRFQDEPIADPVCVPLYYLSRLARGQGIKVCQVGEGADELFWGYPGWKRALLLEQLGRWPGARSLVGGLAMPMLSSLGYAHRKTAVWLDRISRGMPAFWGGAELFPDAEKRDLFAPSLRQAFSDYSSYEVIRPIRKRFEERAWDQSDLNWLTYVDLNLRLPELLLMRVDKMSMAVGLEARVPFLDHKVVEFCMSIPAEAKTRSGTLKYLLKKAVRGLIPDELIDRKKQGFGLPLRDWMMGSLRSEVARCIRSAPQSVFCMQHLAGLIERSDVQRTWALYNVCKWIETFRVQTR